VSGSRQQRCRPGVRFVSIDAVERARAPAEVLVLDHGDRMTMGRLETGAPRLAVLDGVCLPAGGHPVVASYGGDAAHSPGTSAPVPQAAVPPAAPVVVALGVPERGPRGVSLVAEILDAATGRIVEEASGCVTFALDGSPVGSAPLRGGEAELVLPDLPVGRITARLQGDVEHSAAEGATRATA
jgi:hypothetical protein